MSEIFRDMCRTVCRREVRAGTTRGGMTVAARFYSPQDAAALKAALDELTRDETVGGEIWVSAEGGVTPSEEERLRGGDRKIAHCLVVDTLHQREAEDIAERLRQTFSAADVGVFRVISHSGDSNA
jgi:hypothetical protein